MLIFTFHLEKVRTETRTRHISSVISLYTFQGRIVMRIMRRILALVGRLFVTLVVNLCQSGQKWLKPSKVSNKLKKNKSWGISRRFWNYPKKIQIVAVEHPKNSKMSLNILCWDFCIVICLMSISSLVYLENPENTHHAHKAQNLPCSADHQRVLRCLVSTCILYFEVFVCLTNSDLEAL